MNARIGTLGQLMKLKGANDSRFVLMLGAGASLSSEVKKTDVIMTELLEQFGKDVAGEDLADRFDELWRRSTEEQRRMFLTPYLDREPSSGYLELARLVQAGYFDLAITFNYDDLLRKALVKIGFDDYHVVIRGETELGKIAQLVESPPKKFTLLKLHGSLFSSNTFLFDRGEMFGYPPEIGALFGRLTSRDVIVCGYAFTDNCVIRSFSAEGGSVVWVNPSGAPSNAKGLLLNRKSKDHVVSGEFGMFDRFFAELKRELLDPPLPLAEQPPRTNPFRFLESFAVADGAWFFGREDLTREIVDKLSRRPGVLHLIGPVKVGKTSLVRAGVLASLPKESYEWIYVRCRPDLKEQLLAELAARLKKTPVDFGRGVEELARSYGKHLVVVVDQFERVVKGLAASEAGAERLAELMRTLSSGAAEQVTFIFVAVNDSDYIGLMWSAGITRTPGHIDVKPLSPNEAIAVVERQAAKAGLSFRAEILESLRGKLKENASPDRANSFTLAHLQTICYLLAQRTGDGRQSYASLIGSELEDSLDSVIRECDVMNFVEDFPVQHERKLVRVIMKIVSESSRRTIAAHIRDRFADLLQEPQYPEPF